MQHQEHMFYRDTTNYMKGALLMSKELHKPGTDNLPSGEYLEVGPRGGTVPKPRQVTIDPGDRLPPTQEKGRNWVKK